MAADSNAIVNEALMMMGNNSPQISGQAPNFDTSTAGKAAARLYQPCVNFVGRQFGWDFARGFVVLGLTGNAAPPPWSFEYAYPTNGIQIWQLLGAAPDPFDPLPTNWKRGNALVAAVQTSVIWTNLASARAYFNNMPLPSVWDDGFREAVCRLLASEFAIALAGKPDRSMVLGQSAVQSERMAEGRDS